MKKSILFVPLLTAAALMAQSGSLQPPADQNATAQQHRAGRSTQARRQDFMRRFTERLNLTAEQQKQVQAMFRDSEMQAKPLREQLRNERDSLKTAVKSDSEQQIDRITHRNADTLAKLQAIHAKTMAKVYSILTPEQKAKFDAMHSPNARARTFRAQRNG